MPGYCYITKVWLTGCDSDETVLGYCYITEVWLTGCDSDEIVGKSHPATYDQKRGTPTFLYTAHVTRLNISADL